MDNNENNTTPVTENKPVIEIPQEYYNKLKDEARAKNEEMENAKRSEELSIQASQNMSSIFGKVFINMIIIVAIYFLSLKVNPWLLFVLPIIVVVFGFIFAVKDKEKNDYPTSILLSGMLLAVIAYILCMVNEDRADSWMYYTILSAIVGIIGMLIASLVNKLINDKANLKALGILGIILVFGALVGIPYYFYTKNPEEFYHYVFNQNNTNIQAETEEEFITKTLKNRYGLDFTCDNTNVKNQINQLKQRATERTCVANNIEATVQSLAYNEGSNQYIIIDDYIEKLLTDSFKEELQEEIVKVTDAASVNIYIYPEEGCTFVGDCVDSDEYFERLKDETDIENKYKISSNLDLSKYVNATALEFINDYKFKILIEVRGQYTGNEDYASYVNNVLSILNQKGLKNTFGYYITVLNYSSYSSLYSAVYKVKGDTNSEQSFKDPEVINLSE